jgi:hypothetical protein
LSRISPAPRSAARAAHSTASRPAPRREHLPAEALGDLGDQLGTGDRGGVDPDLVGARPQQGVHIGHRPHSPADGQRNKDRFSGTAHHVEHRRTAVRGRGHVEEHEFVGALGVVGRAQLDRVAGVAQVGEVDTLDDPAGVDVQAGNDTYGDGHAAASATASRASATVNAPA